MKKYFLITLILALTAQINAQSNLVFNQVLVLELNSTGTTVPEGRVWKVEDGNDRNYTVNGTTWSTLESDAKSGPTWFPEGSVFTKFTGSNDADILSILEFNVVPTSTTTGGSGGGVSADGFTAIGIVTIQFNDSTAGIYNHLMGTITVPEGEIWKITDARTLRSSLAFGTHNNGNNYLLNTSTYTFIGTHQFVNSFNANFSEARYLTEGSYEVRNWELNGVNTDPASAPVYYQATINGIKYSAN